MVHFKPYTKDILAGLTEAQRLEYATLSTNIFNLQKIIIPMQKRRRALISISHGRQRRARLKCASE